MEPIFGGEISYGNVEVHLRAWCHGEGGAAAAGDKAFFTFRVTEFKHPLLGSQTLVYGHEEISFNFYMANILHSQSLRRRTVSHMLSHLTCFNDPNTFSFWEQDISYLCLQAAVNINGGIQFLVNIHLHTQLNSDQQLSSSTVVEEEIIDDVLILSFLDGNEDEGRGSGGFGGVPASTSAIDALERLKYDDTGSSDCQFGQKGCAICFEDFEEEGIDVTRMPCSHIFHHKCLTLWLEQSRVCPLCRYEMPQSAE